MKKRNLIVALFVSCSAEQPDIESRREIIAAADPVASYTHAELIVVDELIEELLVKCPGYSRTSGIRACE